MTLFKVKGEEEKKRLMFCCLFCCICVYFYMYTRARVVATYPMRTHDYIPLTKTKEEEKEEKDPSPPNNAMSSYNENA